MHIDYMQIIKDTLIQMEKTAMRSQKIRQARERAETIRQTAQAYKAVRP